MPVALSYPGVYIEEVPSGVRTITGVATSITAFVGRTLKGPVNEPITVFSYGEFERIFGGRWSESYLAYSVRDFFQNGGGQAVVVRLFSPIFEDDSARDAAATEAQAAAQAVATAATGASGAANPAAVLAAATAALPPATASDHEKAAAKAVLAEVKKAHDASGSTAATTAAAATPAVVTAAVKTAAAPIFATLDANGLRLEAATPGTWGNRLRARIDRDTSDPADAKLFNLSIRDDSSGVVELFRNVSITEGHARQVDKVLKDGSALVRMAGSALPAAVTAHETLPPAGKTIWDTNPTQTNDKVEDADKGDDGNPLDADSFTGDGLAGAKKGLYALEKADLFNLLCIPPHRRGGAIERSLIDEAVAYCVDRRAMLLVDPLPAWDDPAPDVAQVLTDVEANNAGAVSENAALFFPRLVQPDPEQDGREAYFPPSGAIAGVFARTDANRGVWKAPAGLDAILSGVARLSVSLTDGENGLLNMRGINCLRSMPGAGPVVWGARTRRGDDRSPNDWKYIPVRRLALFIEESLYRGTHWVVFEPNDEPLWASIRLNVGSFMQRLFRQGAFQGSSAREAYFVKCDSETTTQADINLGIVNVLVGFAPLKPAEFVVVRIQQIAGNIPT
jgi:hypothetical protein